MSLSFNDFQAINRERAAFWHGPDSVPWLGVDWSNAMGGECGEAQNVVKKLRRVETGVVGKDDPSYDELRAKLGKEIADTMTYGFLLADHYDLNVAECIADKFNEISEREGVPHRVHA